jgi:uncharacterized membrane protein
MTTAAHTPDWKVTPAHRIMIGLGWAIAVASLALGAAAVIFELPRLWGAVATLAVLAMCVGISLPEPVPRDMFTAGSTRVESRKA